MLEDVEYEGVTFPRDTIVMVSAVTANRDPNLVDFDISADRTGAKPLTFGAGTHFCLGANLARAELQEALSFLAPRMRDLRADGDAQFESIHGIYGMASLPVAFTPA